LVRFHRYNGEDAGRLREAVAQRDVGQLLAATHRVRGSSRTVGATDLALACERMERAAKREDWPEIEAAMRDFDREVARMAEHIAGLAA
jgi:HPt (histidine-containing phosphotransfer) domain-containing protein